MSAHVEFRVENLVANKVFRLVVKDAETQIHAGDVVFGVPEVPISPEAPEEGEIYNFYIGKEYCGPGGIAKRVMKQAEKELLQRNFTSAFLRVHKGNAHAIGFYEREGWAYAGSGEQVFRYKKYLTRECA